MSPEPEHRRARGLAKPGEPARMPAAGRICGQSAGPPSCARPVWSRGLCNAHYKRAARGQPLDPDEGKLVGVTPSGAGVWGVLTDDGEKVLCHECGIYFDHLGVHVRTTHEMSADDYRLRHGLPHRRSLLGPALAARRRAEALEHDAGSRLDGVRATPDPLTRDRTKYARAARLRYGRPPQA